MPYSTYAGNKSKFALPRFVTLKSNQVNVRTGPNVSYPIKWVFTNKGEPVEVIAEFEQWRQISDIDGDTGWVHESMLGGKRAIILIGKENRFIYKQPDDKSNKLCIAEVGARMRLLTCKNKYCQISDSSCKGWIEKEFLWGVYKDEKFK